MKPPPPKVEVDKPSLKRHIRALQKMKDGDLIKIADGLVKCSQVVLRKSQQYVPVETGELKASGKATTTGTGKGAVATVEYTAEHAVPVHERMDLKHAPPTCAKFLERAARESKGTCTSIMKRTIEVS